MKSINDIVSSLILVVVLLISDGSLSKMTGV